MFELEQAIAKWRGRLAAEGIKTPAVLEELESHLRDEIDRQLQSGATEEQAYKAAVSGLGEAEVLRAEFLKINRGTAAERKILKIFYYSSMAFVLLVNAWTLLEYQIGPLERLWGFAAVSIIAVYLACLPHLLKSGPAWRHWRRLRVIKMASSFVLIWPTWEFLEAEHIVHLEIGIVPTVVLWCLCAAIGLTALANLFTNHCRPSGDQGGLPLFPTFPKPIPPTRPCPPDFGGSLPPVQSFAPVALEALEAAGEEASRLGHDFIGTEHVLLGTLKLAKGSFEQLLRQLSLNRETVRMEIEQLVSAVPAHAGRATVPFTPRACRALQFAAREAKKLNQNCVGAEHIFLGLLIEGTGVAGQVLRKLGIRVERAREEILCELRGRPNC